MISADKTLSSRVVWMDYAKAIGIFLVALGHLYSWHSPQSMTRYYIYYFHMPLFFFISGCFHRDIGFYQNIVKGIKSLIIPAIAWNCVWWLLGMCGIVPYVGFHALIRALPNEQNLPCAVTWFLFVCFYCKVMMDLFLNKWTRIGFALAWMVGFAFMHYYNFTFAYVGSAVMVFPFYAVGFHFFKCRSQVVNAVSRIPVAMKIAALAIGLVAFITAPAWYGNTSTMVRRFGDGTMTFFIAGPTMYFLAFIGILMALLVSYWMSKLCTPIRLLEIVGMNTLVIMCIHQFLIRFGIRDFHGGGARRFSSSNTNRNRIGFDMCWCRDCHSKTSLDNLHGG